MCDDTSDESKIRKFNEELEKLDERKCKIEAKAQKILQNISSVTKSIEKAEIDVEKTFQRKMALECEGRLKCDLRRVKEELNRAEEIYCLIEQHYKQKSKQIEEGLKCPPKKK
ncbi:hypothetical protein Trydic_g13394 [Trypoxylus dichotomus]